MNVISELSTIRFPWININSFQQKCLQQLLLDRIECMAFGPETPIDDETMTHLNAFKKHENLVSFDLQ